MYIYIQRWMYSTCLEYLDYSRLVAATFRKTDIGRLLCCSVEDFSYVHGLWMSACLVCRCCVFMFWERRARLHDFGLGQSSLLISWIIWCDPSSPAVSRSVDGYQPQRCIYNIYIYERKGFPVYTRRYHSIPIMMSFHLSYIPLIGSTISIPNGWPSLRTPGLAPRRFSLTRSKSESLFGFAFQIEVSDQNRGKWLQRGWIKKPIVKGIVTRHPSSFDI